MYAVVWVKSYPFAIKGDTEMCGQKIMMAVEATYMSKSIVT